MAQKVELRKRSGGSFSGNDNLMLPVTHIKYVLGLLDENDKLKTSLLPSSMLNTKRLAGSINAATDFASLYSIIQTFNDSNAALYPGTYFISNGKHLISAATDHIIYYNDDNLNASNSVTLEHGDHLFYVKFGSEYAWNDTENTLAITSNAGIHDLTPPYNTISAQHIFATEAEMAATNPLSDGAYALITGFKWVPSNVTEYNAAGYKLNKDGPVGYHNENDAKLVAIPSWELFDYGQGSTVMRLHDVGVGYTYWKLVEVDPLAPSQAKIYQSVSYSNKHIWGVVNNSYDLATTTSAGLMSAADKFKLNNLSYYSHPSYASKSIEALGIEVIDTFESDATGHVTSISKRSLPDAATDTKGVVTLATTTEGRTATDASKALTPAAGLAMLNYNQDMSYFPDLATANGATLPDGATAIVATGTITI